jgi:hypothetical protein
MLFSGFKRFKIFELPSREQPIICKIIPINKMPGLQIFNPIRRMSMVMSILDFSLYTSMQDAT